MVYDPQKNRRRPAPSEAGPAPVDALIRDDSPPTPVVDDPPAAPNVTPPVADPPADSLLVNTGVAIAVGAAGALLLARYLWRRAHSVSAGL